MQESEGENRTESSESTNRRRFLVATGTLGLTALVAGCGGGGGPGVETTEGTDTGMATESPTEGGGMTDTPTETPTATGNETGTETGTGTETDTGTETGDNAQVRVAHLSPNAPNVDVYVDGSAVLEDVSFATVSDYLSVPAGAHTVEITAAGDADTSVFEGEVTVEAGTAYTVAAVGELGEDVDQPFQPLVLTDQNDPPGDDTARLRAVHASPDAPAVDITAGDTVLFDGVEFGGSGYTEVPAGDYTVEIRGDTPENDGDVVADFDVTLEGGQVYTAFAAGYLTPDDEPADTAFDLVVTQDTSA